MLLAYKMQWLLSEGLNFRFSGNAPIDTLYVCIKYNSQLHFLHRCVVLWGDRAGVILTKPLALANTALL